MIVANVAVAFHLHGTMWAGGHAMTVLLAMGLMWMGVLYHHYPVITGRELDNSRGNRSTKFYFIGGVGLMYSFMAGGASGMPRRIANWTEGGYMIIGFSILAFGLVLIYGITLYLALFSLSVDFPS